MSTGAFFLLTILVLSPIFLFLWIKEIKKRKIYKKEVDDLKIQSQEDSRRALALVQALEEKSQELSDITKRAEPLWQYQDLHDAVINYEDKIRAADSSAKDIINNAMSTAEKIMSDANHQAELTISNASAEAISITRDARDARLKAKEKLDLANEKANEIINNAHDNATSLIQSAENKAKEIAGAAYEAREFAEKFKDVAQSMKNKIHGYGDEWIIPNQSVLDELAEAYEFSDSGRELIKARQLTKSLIQSIKAADCDYVEPLRKNTAIKFVLDAFNGKVDTVLSKVKNNNYGKLAQEIKDAFNLVNYNGAAFRSARITDTFLQARLNELKWAVAVHEIMLQEKEEQRRIKEQLREEEKARREYEKAIKEAEKEEKAIKQAIEKATKEMLDASEEQRLTLEKKLQELQRKYDEAEAKNQRAISMAQQTRSGHVYVISNIGSFGEDVFKIGMTRRLEPLERIYELSDASVPFAFDVHAMIYSEDAPSLENSLHKVFKGNQLNKMNNRKEFFNVTLKEIKSAIDRMNINAHWTIFAEAKEYRESLALEREKASSSENEQDKLVVA
ncbi:DUF4041 domain-containing protein [Dickeya chrysanthemi]|uniref:DUF4041 domain-containing protein n=2 Tax=Dickeya chrysanthemi TaxID=556 RepID=A0ABU8JKS8_DICCH|nr:DUF4041 domain-containing protein [Dickeya chrysanthemi]MBX9444460.1 DUF4041 domain-containing protein [Dickeya chrysanthemi]